MTSQDQQNCYLLFSAKFGCNISYFFSSKNSEFPKMKVYFHHFFAKYRTLTRKHHGGSYKGVQGTRKHQHHRQTKGALGCVLLLGQIVSSMAFGHKMLESQTKSHQMTKYRILLNTFPGMKMKIKSNPQLFQVTIIRIKYKNPIKTDPKYFI